VRLDVLLNAQTVDASALIHEDNAYNIGKKWPKIMNSSRDSNWYPICCNWAKFIARETIKALRKDVTAMLWYDISRKRKLLESRKKVKRECDK
jgi:GTP-binding protein LepA